MGDNNANTNYTQIQRSAISHRDDWKLLAYFFTFGLPEMFVIFLLNVF